MSNYNPADVPKVPMTYEEIKDIVETGVDYLQGSTPSSVEKTRKAVCVILDTLRDSVPAVQGGFGVGFPYHSVDGDGTIVPNPEFTRFNERLTNLLGEEAVKKGGGNVTWPCSEQQGLPGHLPDDCKECVITAIKPREIMRAIPDVDLFVVASDTSEDTKKEILSTAFRHGFHQSDFSAGDALARVDGFMDHGIDQAFPPADIHLISLEELHSVFYEYVRGNYDARPELWSMYGKWKNNRDINFWFDLVFTGFWSDYRLPDSTEKLMMDARKSIVERLGPEEVMHRVRTMSSRADVLLDHKPTRDAYLARMDSLHD